MWSPLDANSTAREMVLQGFDWSHDHVSLPKAREMYRYFPSVTVPTKRSENNQILLLDHKNTFKLQNDARPSKKWNKKPEKFAAD